MRRGGGFVTTWRSIARRRLELARVLVIVTVDAEELPVAAVRRIVVVVVVLVVDGQLVDIGAVELAGAASADPGEELERLLAIGLRTRLAAQPRFGDDAIETSGVWSAALLW